MVSVLEDMLYCSVHLHVAVAQHSMRQHEAAAVNRSVWGTRSSACTLEHWQQQEDASYSAG
jgi:hypothetical protein